MLVVMEKGASRAQIEAVAERIRALGCEAALIPGHGRTAIGVLGDELPDSDRLIGLGGVMRIVRITPPYRLASREWRPDDTIIELENGTRVGGDQVAVIAGPCAVESETQIVETAVKVREAGATLLRGGAYKPRTSPYSFQGLGERGLRLLALARRESGLPVVSEAPSPETVTGVAEHVDIIQIGARNMQNYALLRAVGRAGRPVLLKRGPAATLQELLLAAEYILLEGEPRVILCERGVRNFDVHARNLLDLTAIPSLKELSHLPVIADPSHGTGQRSKVVPMARAAVAAGADGVMLEVHPDPGAAASDGGQAVTPDQLGRLVVELRQIAAAIGRHLAVDEPVASGAGHVA